MKEAAKNRKLVAESSVQLCNTLSNAMNMVAGLVSNIDGPNNTTTTPTTLKRS